MTTDAFFFQKGNQWIQKTNLYLLLSLKQRKKVFLIFNQSNKCLLLME